MVFIKRALRDWPRFAIVGNVRNVKKLTERHRHGENTMAQIMADKHIKRRFVDIARIGERVERV